jgi:hypothetical protein
MCAYFWHRACTGITICSLMLICAYFWYNAYQCSYAHPCLSLLVCACFWYNACPDIAMLTHACLCSFVLISGITRTLMFLCSFMLVSALICVYFWYNACPDVTMLTHAHPCLFLCVLVCLFLVYCV